MFDIPIANNVKPAMDLGGAPVQQPIQQQYQQPVQQQYQQPIQQNSNPRPAGGGVSLAKGQKVSLTKMNPNLSEIMVGLGWDVQGQSAVPYDLDVEAFLLGANEKVVGDDWFVFYNQPSSPDGSVRISPDNRTGEGTGDDEYIDISLSRVSPQVEKILFVVTINEALTRGHNFGQVSNAYIRVVDKSTGQEIIKFSLTDYYANVTSMVVGELYLKGGEWRFNPVGNGLEKDLSQLCEYYGVNLA